MSFTYACTHLNANTTHQRPSTFPNPYIKHHGHSNRSAATTTDDSLIQAYHRSLPFYASTPLHPLPSIAQSLGFAHVFLKDESQRFSLPSFKILGASWATHRALCQRLGLDASASVPEVQTAVQSMKTSNQDLRIVTATDGNWGRAMARMARFYGVGLEVYVPGFMVEATQALIRGEGALVKVLRGMSYDVAVQTAVEEARRTSALLVMDTSFEGYEEIPQWVADGYETLLLETDEQVAARTDGMSVSLATASVGVGCWAKQVVAHYKALPTPARVATIEPSTAASFKESLHMNALTSIDTGDTIMCGMNCGSTATIAWPVLRDGVDFAVAVTDRESHECVLELQDLNIDAGPCGAANLVALRRLCAETELVERENMVVVLFSTEGRREYDVPG